MGAAENPSAAPISSSGAQMVTEMRRPARTLALCLIVVALVSCGSTDEPQPPGPEQRVATKKFVSRKGKYSFKYPPQWSVVRDGTRTKLTTPSGDAIVAFGVAPEGQPAHEQFLETFQRAYTDVEVGAAQRQKLNGKYPALLVSGRGTNQRGVRLRFLAITVFTDTGDYVIDIFTLSDSDPRKVLPPVHEVVNSFMPL